MAGTITLTYGTAGVSFTNVGFSIKESTGDSGVLTSKDIWLQGFAQTGTTKATPVAYLYFDSTLGSNWTVRMGVNDPAGGPTNVSYIISYYSK